MSVAVNPLHYRLVSTVIAIDPLYSYLMSVALYPLHYHLISAVVQPPVLLPWSFWTRKGYEGTAAVLRDHEKSVHGRVARCVISSVLWDQEQLWGYCPRYIMIMKIYKGTTRGPLRPWKVIRAMLVFLWDTKECRGTTHGIRGCIIDPLKAFCHRFKDHSSIIPRVDTFELCFIQLLTSPIHWHWFQIWQRASMASASDFHSKHYSMKVCNLFDLVLNFTLHACLYFDVICPGRNMQFCLCLKL